MRTRIEIRPEQSSEPSKRNPKLMRTQNREQNRDRPVYGDKTEETKVSSNPQLMSRTDTNGGDRPSGGDISSDHHANIMRIIKLDRPSSKSTIKEIRSKQTQRPRTSTDQLSASGNP
ncbi:hypothetical protein U1Q18_035928 [Sarracenia purpurea var. burkii]